MILSSAQMHGADKYAVESLGVPSLKLMESAAEALRSNLPKDAKHIVILTGKGNNAGDGWALSAILKNERLDVNVISLFSDGFSADCAEMRRRAVNLEVCEFVLSEDPDNSGKAISNADTIVDCVFGTGFTDKKALDGHVLQAMRIANNSTATKIACDIPSGVSSDTGYADRNAFRADITVTFAALKPCFFLYPAKEYCGKVVTADISMPQKALESCMPYMFAVTDETPKSIIKQRKQNTHKGSYGALKMICGSKNMTGAAVLAANSALRTGVGLLYMSSDVCTRRIFQARLSEPVFNGIKDVTGKESAVLVGCGLSRKKAHLVKFALSLTLPTVIDADALTYTGKHINILQRAKSPLILTPHPAEMSRLCGLSVAEIEKDRIHVARTFATENNVVLVLKGHHTITATPDGSIFINTTGNAGLAKGGGGDTLAGMIASFLAQGLSAEESAVAGVWLHGKAADVLKCDISEYGMLPSDIPYAAAKILKDFNALNS